MSSRDFERTKISIFSINLPLNKIKNDRRELFDMKNQIYVGNFYKELKSILEHTRIVAHSRSSTRQSVFLTSEQSSKNQWQIESFDPLLRPEYEDKPVPHGTSLIIKHTLTGQVS